MLNSIPGILPLLTKHSAKEKTIIYLRWNSQLAVTNGLLVGMVLWRESSIKTSATTSVLALAGCTNWQGMNWPALNWIIIDRASALKSAWEGSSWVTIIMLMDSNRKGAARWASMSTHSRAWNCFFHSGSFSLSLMTSICANLCKCAHYFDCCPLLLFVCFVRLFVYQATIITRMLCDSEKIKMQKMLAFVFIWQWKTITNRRKHSFGLVCGLLVSFAFFCLFFITNFNTKWHLKVMITKHV